MRFFLFVFLILLGFGWVSGLEAQIARVKDGDTEMGVALNDRQFVQVETQLGEGLPSLLDKLKDTAEAVKAGEWEKADRLLEEAKVEGRREQKVLEQGPQYAEIEAYVEKIRSAFERSDQAVEKRQKGPALQNLAQAYKWAKAISESPVLKLSATEIALGQASRQLSQGNYSGAGLFLQRAIDNITEVQKDPRVNSEALNKLKSDIIVTQQQVVLGKLHDEKRLKRFVPGLAAARVNALNTYYSVWDRSDMPWDLY